MQLNAYCIYDNKALVYGVPFFAPSDGAAIRSFRDLANDANTTVCRHPGDFSLFCVGLYDDANGALSGLSPLRHLIDATAVIFPSPAPIPLFEKKDGDTYETKSNGAL